MPEARLASTGLQCRRIARGPLPGEYGYRRSLTSLRRSPCVIHIDIAASDRGRFRILTNHIDHIDRRVQTAHRGQLMVGSSPDEPALTLTVSRHNDRPGRSFNHPPAAEARVPNPQFLPERVQLASSRLHFDLKRLLIEFDEEPFLVVLQRLKASLRFVARGSSPRQSGVRDDVSPQSQTGFGVQASPSLSSPAPPRAVVLLTLAR